MANTSRRSSGSKGQEEPFRVLIASRHLPGSTGGLAAYQRGLAIELGQSMEVAFLAAEPGGPEPRSLDSLPVPSQILNCRIARPAWMSMASRPALHPLLKPWIAAAFRKAAKSAAWIGFPDGCTPDVIHYVGTGWDFAGFGFMELARRAGAQFTVWPAVHPGQWGDDVIDIGLYRLADAVFCQSPGEKNHLVERGLPPEKAVPCGLPPMCRPDGDGREFRAQWNLGDRPVVLFIGRRDEGKGYPALLKAWELVLAKNPGALLVLAGPGGAGSVQLPAPSFVDLGVPDELTKASALEACDVFCLPSAHESFGIVFAEAWSYGKPVICGPAPASREWIQNGVTGLHADQNPGSIAAAINQLLADNDLRLRMGSAGREFQMSRLTWDIVGATHIRAFGF